MDINVLNTTWILLLKYYMEIIVVKYYVDIIVLKY